MADGLIHFTARADALRFERIRMRGLVSEAQDLKAQLQIELGMLIDCMQAMLENGVAKDAIAEALLALHTPIVNADHACNRTIDEAGEWFDPLDMAEANALLARIRA